MRSRDLVELMLLSLLWGAAYLFTRAAVPAFGPSALVASRLGLAALVLLPILALRGEMPALRLKPGALLVQGVVFTALPFMLLSWASLHITGGLVAVLNATAPLFAALVAHSLLGERIGGWRAVGLVVGFAGVAALMWGHASFRSTDGVLAVAAVLLCSALWGFGGHFTRRRLAGIDAMAITVGSLAAAALCMAPLAYAHWPAQTPPARAWAEVAFLGVASSGMGFLLYYRLLRRIGPVRAMSVTFLNPVVAMVSGAFYLGETVTLQMLAGGAVVLLGTALSLGLIGPAARPRPAVAIADTPPTATPRP